MPSLDELPHVAWNPTSGFEDKRKTKFAVRLRWQRYEKGFRGVSTISDAVKVVDLMVVAITDVKCGWRSHSNNEKLQFSPDSHEAFARIISFIVPFFCKNHYFYKKKTVYVYLVKIQLFVLQKNISFLVDTHVSYKMDSTATSSALTTVIWWIIIFLQIWSILRILCIN